MTEAKNLYGGAVSALIPTNACDISKVRQVPDNQEVFAHLKTDQSIIFDILQYENIDDNAAAEFHFKDLIGTLADSSTYKINSIKKLERPSLQHCDCVYYLFGEHLISKYNEAAKNLVNLHLVLFRFKNYETDILITFNDPVYINPESSSFTASSSSSLTNANSQEDDVNAKWTIEQFMKTVDSFRIIDYNLFNAS